MVSGRSAIGQRVAEADLQPEPTYLQVRALIGHLQAIWTDAETGPPYGVRPVYTAAQQTADWGALLEPGDTLDIRIYQLSALVGRGARKVVTLSF